MKIHPTETRTTISPPSEVELNTTSALANYATEAAYLKDIESYQSRLGFVIGQSGESVTGAREGGVGSEFTAEVICMRLLKVGSCAGASIDEFSRNAPFPMLVSTSWDLERRYERIDVFHQGLLARPFLVFYWQRRVCKKESSEAGLPCRCVYFGPRWLEGNSKEGRDGSMKHLALAQTVLVVKHQGSIYNVLLGYLCIRSVELMTSSGMTYYAGPLLVLSLVERMIEGVTDRG
uniref:Uncharacterized protein n=1 Tax=Timema douglasi TaxID=61478 RepID=A0A7R8VLK1_TIMDO|nr:unnamed protein product [Timema douglasi]